MFGPDRPGIFEGKVDDLEQRVMNPAPQDVVLLTGSSYFELWKTSDRDLAGLNTVDVGIGGTRIGDQIHYFDRLVRPFNPSAVVVYAGSNDISGLPFFSRTADEVVPRVKEYVSPPCWPSATRLRTLPVDPTGRPTWGQRGDRQDPPGARLRQAGCGRPRGGRQSRLRARPAVTYVAGVVARPF